MTISPSNRAFCLQIWARMKQTARPVSKNEVIEFKKKLDTLSLEDRHDPHFHMAQGLLRAALHESNAVQSWEKALSLSPQFVEARREINSFLGKSKEKDGMSASDILTGDITSIVSNIFKRKSK
jgi:hypothetical protein